MSKVQDQKNIDAVLSSEANSLTKMQNAIGELLDANQQLKGSIELKQKVDALKKEAPSLPWFKRFVQIIPQVKYLFIKNDEQIAAERREINREILTYVDNTLTKVGKKSSSLQVIIDKELQKGLDKILNNESSLPEQLERAGKLQEHLSSLGVSQKDFREIVPKFYNAKEAVALMHERTQLTQIQQDITELVNANSKVQGLLAIKKELAELQQELPSTWLDNLKKSVAKIKYAFVKSQEQILKNTVTKNNETLHHIDNALKTTGKIIESSKLDRQNKLQKELENLKKRKLLPEQSERVKLLSSEIDLTFSKIISTSEPLLTTIGQEQSPSQALHSSMPNLQTVPLRPAPPPPHLANASLPNQAVQQQNTIPPAPPLPGGTGLQQAAGSIPRPTRPAPPPPPPLTPTTSLPDINAPQPEEHARRASMPSSTKRHAPPLPVRTTSLQNLADPQPNIAAEIPPAPPPPHVVPGLQQGAHQEPQVIPPPPPLPPTATQPVPPPLPGGFDQPLPPPPPPPPPPGQTNNPVAANPIEGQENAHGQLLDEINKGIQLKSVAVSEKKPVETRDDLLAAIRAGLKLKKVGTDKQHKDAVDKTKAGEKPSIATSLRDAILARAKAFQPDDDDEHPHAELVEFINNKDIDEYALISKLNAKEDKDINSKEKLIEFIGKDFREQDFDEWEEADQEKKQTDIVKKLNELKEKYENNALDLSAKPVVEVVATKEELPKKLQAEAKAIVAAIPKSKNVTGANKPLPPPPLPPKIRPVGGQGV